MEWLHLTLLHFGIPAWFGYVGYLIGRERMRARCRKIAMAHGWDEAFGGDAAWNIADAIREVK